MSIRAGVNNIIINCDCGCSKSYVFHDVKKYWDDQWTHHEIMARDGWLIFEDSSESLCYGKGHWDTEDGLFFFNKTHFCVWLEQFEKEVKE